MSLLKNACESIELGLEDFESDDEKRLLAAVRTLHTGVLLLFKERLRQLSPPGSEDVLIKANIVPKLIDGRVTLVGRGKKTVDRQQIRTYFDGLGISVPWKRVDELAEIRNNAEHYFSRTSKDEVRQAIANTAAIVAEFVQNELQADPLELFGQETWSRFLNIADVYEKEASLCREACDQFDWPLACTGLVGALRCLACGSRLVVPIRFDSDVCFSLRCRSCSSESKVELSGDFEKMLKDATLWEEHTSIKDGGDPPICDCPKCGRRTFSTDSDYCLACGYEAQHKSCARCESEIELDLEVDESLCGYCLNMSDQVWNE